MNIALVLAGGTGLRVGSEIPKQYIEVHGKPIIAYCLSVFALHKDIHGIQIVADETWREFIRNKMAAEPVGKIFQEKFRGFSRPGENRQLSILHGLEDIYAYGNADDAVIIHDAARPGITESLISASLASIKSHDGVLPVLPMKDTVYSSADGERITSLLDRSRIFAGQAPETFQLGKYYEANIRLLPDRILEINGSTEPAILAEMDIAMIPGEERNFKITTREDLMRFKDWVDEIE